MAEVVLNKGQQQAHDEMLQTIVKGGMTDDERFHTFSGGAGFGKSTTVVALLRSIPVTKSVCLTAPTHKAVKVLAKMLEEQGLAHRCDVKTIHSALGLKLIQKGDKEVCIPDPYADIQDYDVLGVDECSMLDDLLVGYILECNSKTIIFIGDEYQIEPVGTCEGDKSCVFTAVSRQSKLKEVVRCALDNPIIQLATALRNCQDDMFANLPQIVQNVDEKGHGIRTLGLQAFAQELVTVFQSDAFKADYDYARCLAYTNDQVDIINRFVRESIHGKDVPEFVVGEIVIAQEMSETYRNAEEFEVMNIVKDTCFEHDDDGIDCIRLTLKSTIDQRIHSVKTVSVDGRERLEYNLNTLAKKANDNPPMKKVYWREYWRLKKDFKNFKHVYCMTTHKSQGSTFTKTYVYLPDFLKYGVSQTIKRLLYTGTTRSSETTTFAMETL